MIVKRNYITERMAFIFCSVIKNVAKTIYFFSAMSYSDRKTGYIRPGSGICLK